MKEGYVLARGDAGAHRLAVLNAAMWPSSHALLRQAGLAEGKAFLDVGCGAGDLTRRVADLGIDATGVDIDAAFIERAKAVPSPARFEACGIAELPTLNRRFDIVYARYLLSHLPDPATGLSAMMATANPGGAVVVEDIDFDLHIAEPRPPAFDRYLDLYRAVVQRRKGNPTLGRHLFRLAHEAGLREVEVRVHIHLPTQGPGRNITTLTLAGIRDTLIREGLATEGEIDDLLEELTALESDPQAIVSVAGTYQVWGRV